MLVRTTQFLPSLDKWRHILLELSIDVELSAYLLNDFGLEHTVSVLIVYKLSETDVHIEAFKELLYNLLIHVVILDVKLLEYLGCLDQADE